MSDSVLFTAEVPGFDASTAQLTLERHHLVSTAVSYINSFPLDTVLYLDPPPRQPYQQEQQGAEDPAAAELDAKPRRKRRRVAPSAESASPADWLLHREKEERRTTTDRETDEHHASISLGLETAINAIRQGWSAAQGDEKGWMGEVGDRVRWREGAAEDSRAELNLVKLAGGVTARSESVLRLEGSLAKLPVERLFHRIVLNPSHSATCVVDMHDGAEDASKKLASLLIPPSSGFLLADFFSWSSASSGIAALGKEVGGWNVVVIDPPWPNASATRSSSYDTFDAYDLWKLDLPALLGDKPALVAVWLTNKVKYRRLLLDKLFPAWHIQSAAEWYWVKIASETGEPVWRLDAKHRRCYEGLLVGYYVPPATKVDLPSLPPNKVFLSTPIGHSRKLVLVDLLRPFLLDPSKPPNVLELFARTTLSGFRAASHGEEAAASGGVGRGLGERGTFLAVGNEAVKFNVVDEEGADATRGWLSYSAKKSE
ncbi:hypothetical protein JCM6882_008364 [Rhodosporidiobolus microsporus]